MSKVIQQRSMAVELFSNALFCLWLSTACLMVWVDLGAGPRAPAAQSISTVVSKPAAAAAAPDRRAASPVSDGGADAA